MARKRSYPLFENILVEKYAALGRGIAYVDGRVVFIDGAIPGDRVNAQAYKYKKEYAEAFITQLITKSQFRTQAFCQHFTLCGGCKWQHLDYAKQLEYKRQEVVDNLERIAQVVLPKNIQAYASPKTQFYRNQLEFSFSTYTYFAKEDIGSEEQGALGFHARGFFDKVVQINRCFLMDDLHNLIRNSIYDYAQKHNLQFYNPRLHTGFLRSLRIRNNRQGEFLLLLVVAYKDPVLFDLLQFLQEQFIQIKSIYYAINSKKNDSLYDLAMLHFAGEEFLQEELHGLVFYIRPLSFFQTNPWQAENLYALVKDFLHFENCRLHRIYDLYCGAGTISMLVSDMATEVIGIETNPQAILSAREAAKLNKIDNVRFWELDLAKIKQQKLPMQAEAIVVNPPRAGLNDTVIQFITELKPDILVYVSCNSATQARDLSQLKDLYNINKLAVVDMFPHTHHIESILQLIRK